MSEQQEDSKTWLEKLSLALSGEPSSRSELLELLRSAEQRALLDGEALSIIEGALTVSDMQVREIMVPRAQVVFVRIDEEPAEFLPTVIGSGHSRFPVLGENQDEVVGILLAKDLLSLAHKDRKQKFNLRDSLRPCTAIPESKRLDILLQEFRATRNHLAVVYDEYGGISGIVTIEDVLEQIVGDIEDEYDFEEEGFINKHADGSFTIKALTPIEDFNEYFEIQFSDEEFDTIGGLVTSCFGHLPKRDEEVAIDQFQFKVLNADGRRVHLLQMNIVE
ncbi:MAG: CBS domain-containing protein [Pseudomonadales bacterium]|nr:CBS domain-containing protein [Pseudomonadales bacterium]MBO6597953.1 CBS domain-containing protein [Pseudomonadales bacterium]MBO6704168.1 CBS domain-containing protein [Pseudomonadales bacterium]MBO6823025.1 CBS domain-containing protein [Pseudomonadales bacterium]MBO7006025.1 CBS domain-containing protein [Pseudomonadales bacterium]